MIEFLKDYAPYILPLLCVGVNAILAFVCKHYVNLEKIKSEDLKKQVEEIGKDCDCMKCRLDSYRESKDSLECTRFDKIVPEFKFDEQTGKTYKSGEIDLQELINSSAECALDKILERLGGVIPSNLAVPGNISFKDDVGFVETINDDLDALRENQEYFAELRSRYNLDDSMSDTEVIKYLESVKTSVKSATEELMKKKEEKENA